MLNFSEQMGDTRCRHNKEKGRAETLPYKMFVKSENLFYSPNQHLPKSIEHNTKDSFPMIELTLLYHRTARG